MELGLEFDDEDLSASLKQTKITPKSYNAKFTAPEWFERLQLQIQPDGQQDWDRDTTVTILKFMGDFRYGARKYGAAASCFEKALAILPDHNRPMRWDMSQSCAWCYIHQGRFKEALDIGTTLHEEAATVDQLLHTHLLLADVHHAAGNYNKEISILKPVIMENSFCYTFWQRLADALEMSLKSDDTVGQSQGEVLYGDNNMRTEEDLGCRRESDTSGESTRLKILTCYTRILLILQASDRNVRNVFKKEQKIMEKITILEPDKEIQHMVRQHLCVDMTASTNEDEEDIITSTKSKDVLGTASDLSIQKQVPVDVNKVFDEKWFSWIDQINTPV